MAIKIGIGKLELPTPLSDFMDLAKQTDIQTAKLSEADLINLLTIPLHHKDPFDRLLISQAIQADLTIISKDKQFDVYNVRRIW